MCNCWKSKNHFSGSFKNEQLSTHLKSKSTNTLKLVNITTEGGDDTSNIFDEEHFLIFDDFVIIDCGLLAGVVDEDCDEEGDYDAYHLWLDSGFLFDLVLRRNDWLGMGLGFGKFDLLQLELFHFYY